MGDRFKTDPAYRQRLAEAGLDSVEKIVRKCFDATGGQGRALVQFEVPSEQSPQRPSMTVKGYVYPTWGTRLNFIGRCFFARSRVAREWRRLRMMVRLGINSSRPVALGERRTLGFLTHCFLVTEGVPASDSLRDFACRYFHKAASPRGRELKREMMDRLADNIRQMHEHRFYHCELTWDNILIRPTPSGGFEFFFINALRGRRVLLPHRRRQLAARDLAGIDAVPNEFLSRADKIRFIKQYLKAKELTGDHRQWMGEIQQLSSQEFVSQSTYRSAHPAEATPPSSRQVQTGANT